MTFSILPKSLLHCFGTSAHLRCLLLIFLTLATSCTSPAHKSTASVAGTAKSFRLTTDSGTWEIEPPSIDRYDASWDAVTLIDHRKVGRKDYLLLLASGPSKGDFGGGYCGAGIEDTLIWLALRRGQIVDFDHRRVHSCFDNVELEQLWLGTRLFFTGFELRGGHIYDVRISYDLLHPANGFILFEKLDQAAETL